MQDGSVQALLATIRDGFSLVSDWAVGIFLLLFAVAVALALHKAFVEVSRRSLGLRHPYLHSLFFSTKGLTRLAFVMLALSVALPAISIDTAISVGIRQALSVGMIVLLCWIALTAIDITADIYLQRFRLDVDDNLLARKHVTQIRVLKRTMDIFLIVVATAAALMTFESVRQYGVSLFASAGIAGLVVGFAARPVLSNLIAGVQLAVTQPIRIDDAVVVEKEWGRVEEITSTYVVIRLWDLRRLIVPLAYFIEKPFENWTRESASILGSVFLYADHSVPVDRLREKLKEIVEESKLWDGQVAGLQVTDMKEHAVELRALVSARSSSAAWDLRCEVRERLIAFLREECPGALPRQRAAVELSSVLPIRAAKEERPASMAGALR